MTIQYEVYSDKKEDFVLVANYWAKDEEGKFVHKVASLIPYGDITNAAQLTKYINKISKAWYERFRCTRCEEYIRVWSRTTSAPRHREVCDECRQVIEEESRRQRHKRAAELQRRADLIAKMNEHLRVNYSLVSDDVALLLLALRKVVKPELLWGLFELEDCEGLGPAHIGGLLNKLERAGVLVREFSSTFLHKYVRFGDDELLLDSNKTAYRLVQDKSLGKSEAVFNMLQLRDYRDFAVIRELWLDLAVADCLKYLYLRCELYDLALTEDQVKRLESIFRVALETYSIAQVWFIAWAVVRDLAAYSASSYSNKYKAAKLIPTRVQQYVERAKKEEKVLSGWKRSSRHPVGTLGAIFYELFGINEDTPSVEVMRRLSVRGADKDCPDLIGEITETIMRRALAMNLGGEVMISFSESIRQGKSVQEALGALLERYPQLDEWI